MAQKELQSPFSLFSPLLLLLLLLLLCKLICREMERWRNEIDRQSARRCRDYPSFSSTLLDAIYRSIDETDSRGAQDRISARKESAPAFPESRRISPMVTKPAVTRSRRTTTSSSSDGSSYGSFSSSDTESANTPRPPPLRPIRTNPIRSDHFRPDHCISSRIDEKRGKKERNGSIRSCLRDLKNARSPSSPGARLANFLTSIFAAKSKVSAELACSTEQPCSRSRLSKTPSTAKRTVSFCPVSVIVGEDCRPCGEKWVYGGEVLKAAAPPPVRRLKVEEQEDEEEDLFELKNLAVIGRFRDELPVYHTTRMGKCGGVHRGLIL